MGTVCLLCTQQFSDNDHSFGRGALHCRRRDVFFVSVERPRKESRDWLVDHVGATTCAHDVGEAAKDLQPACSAMSFFVVGVEMSV